MSDEQDLRDALQSAIPRPPRVLDRAREARATARQYRRRRRLAVAAAGAVVAAAVPVAHVLHHAPQPTELPGVVAEGTPGMSRCRQAKDPTVGRPWYAQVVTGSTAAAWLQRLHRDVPTGLARAHAATVCVMGHGHTFNYETLLLQPGRHPLVVARDGSYDGLSSTMLGLSAVQETAPASTVAAPFRCPAFGSIDSEKPEPAAASAVLPTGTTGALICYDGWYAPTIVLDSSVDDLVAKINAAPLTYRRNDTCGGGEGEHGYSFVLRYPNGIRTVSGDLCGWLDVGPVQRREAAPPFGDLLMAKLLQQEATVGTTQPADCPPPSRQSPSGVGDLVHVVSARFCPAGTTGAGALLSSRQLQRLTGGPPRGEGTDGFQLFTTEIEHSCRRPTSGWPHLMLADAWHNQFSVTLKCKDQRFWEIHVPSPGRPIRPVLIFGVGGLIRQLVATVH